MNQKVFGIAIVQNNGKKKKPTLKHTRGKSMIVTLGLRGVNRNNTKCAVKTYSCYCQSGADEIDYLTKESMAAQKNVLSTYR